MKKLLNVGQRVSSFEIRELKKLIQPEFLVEQDFDGKVYITDSKDCNYYNLWSAFEKVLYLYTGKIKLEDAE